MLTADTITDEQIGKLRVEYLYAKPFADSYGVDVCDEALGRPSRYSRQACKPDAHAIRKARARCAEILNARTPKPVVVPLEPEWSPYRDPYGFGPVREFWDLVGV